MGTERYHRMRSFITLKRAAYIQVSAKELSNFLSAPADTKIPSRMQQTLPDVVESLKTKLDEDGGTVISWKEMCVIFEVR